MRCLAESRNLGTRYHLQAHLIMRATVAFATAMPRWQGTAHDALSKSFAFDGAGADIVRRALVLHADHELNTSTFVVRCVASTMAAFMQSIAFEWPAP
ncbi:MAG: hypothetical protein JSR72_20360 [Proteobacteria bacterium]|nr:hypothetical protein [Pseudomonadota bacterium]